MLSLAPFQMVLLNPVQNLGKTNLHAPIISPFLRASSKSRAMNIHLGQTHYICDPILLSTSIPCFTAFAISCHLIPTSLNRIHLFDKVTRYRCLKTTHISSKQNECPLEWTCRDGVSKVFNKYEVGADGSHGCTILACMREK